MTNNEIIRLAEELYTCEDHVKLSQSLTKLLGFLSSCTLQANDSVVQFFTMKNKETGVLLCRALLNTAHGNEMNVKSNCNILLFNHKEVLGSNIIATLWCCKALTSYKQKQFTQALEYFANCLKEKEHFLTAVLHRAIIYSAMNTDHQRKALTELDLCVKLCNTEAMAYAYRGSLKHSLLNKPEDALADLERAIGLDPLLYEAHLFRGNLYASKQSKNLTNATLDFTTAREIDPKRCDAYRCHSRLLLELTEYNEAFTSIETAVNLDPDCIPCLLTRADMYSEILGDFEAAIADYSTILDIDSHNIKARTLRARCHAQTGSYELELDDYEELLLLLSEQKITMSNLEKANLLYRKSMLYLDVGDEPKARQALDYAIQLNPRLVAKKWF